MRVPFLDLRRVNSQIDDQIQQAIGRILKSGWYILGTAGEIFEGNFKSALSGEQEGYVIGCNSGTDALVLSLLAADVKPGDEVITVAHTAIPTISAISSVEAKPVFVDINPKTWVMDVTKAVNAITLKTKAIIPVHLYGNMVNVNELNKYLRDIGREDIAVIEDVAQAQGAKLFGVQAGTLGTFGAFSFYPSKNIGALGDAGAVFCHNLKDAEILKMLRNYGQKDRYNALVSRGINSRLDEMQAAILDIKLAYLEQWNKKKARIMEFYRKELASLPLKFQQVTEGYESGWHLCVIALEDGKTRNDFIDYLASCGIQTLIHYPIPAHQQKAFCSNPPISLPVTENLVSRIVSLPMNTALTADEQELVVETIQSFFAKKL